MKYSLNHNPDYYNFYGGSRSKLKKHDHEIIELTNPCKNCGGSYHRHNTERQQCFMFSKKSKLMYWINEIVYHGDSDQLDRYNFILNKEKKEKIRKIIKEILK